uniref:E3 ubiquitin-protein ligase TRIM39-like n=1 Tax=Denticeps clupeoides TaxID=299321 RepID=A0AAY4ACU6_9TELE
MASSSTLLSVEQFQCSICLDVFNDPVSTPCGHNFCITCIRQNWDSSAVCQCPLCKEVFFRRPGLKINTTLREVVDHVKQMIGGCADMSPAKTAPKLQKHKLIDPVQNLEDRMCKKHDRPLELFCKKEQVCVCGFCTEGEHRNHYTVSLEEEGMQRKVKIKKLNVDEEISVTAELFSALVSSIERNKANLIEVIEQKQKTVEDHADGIIKELEQEINDLQKRNTELEQLTTTQDHLYFLQVSQQIYGFHTTSLCVPPHTKNWTAVQINTYTDVETLAPVVSKLEDLINGEMEKLHEKRNTCVSTDLNKIQQYAVDVTLDSKTAHPYLILSADGKQVQCGNKRQKVPDNPARFDRAACVLGKEGFSSGRFYFEVLVTDKNAWDLGVARESAKRKGKLKATPENGYWTVVLRNRSEYMAKDSTPTPLTLRQKPQRVGVFVDYETGLVSFYDVEAICHIYSFHGRSFSEKLYPFFSPSLNDGGKNFGPLVILPENNTK